MVHGPLVATWETATGSPGRSLGGRVDKVTAIGFSADGRWLAATGDSGAVDLWRLDAVREPRRILLDAGEPVAARAIDPHGRWLAAASAGSRGHLVDLAGGGAHDQWHGVDGLVASPDGDLLFAVGRDGYHAWRSSDRKLAEGVRWPDEPPLTRIAIAAFDAAHTHGNIRMRLARAGESFLGIGMDAPVVLKGVEVLCEDDEGLIAIYPHRDSHRTRVTAGTTDTVFMTCGVPGIAGNVLVEAAGTTQDFVERFCR